MSVSSINGPGPNCTQWAQSASLNSANNGSSADAAGGDSAPPGGGLPQGIIAALQSAVIGTSNSANTGGE
jgi:hypothetical protein